MSPLLVFRVLAVLFHCLRGWSLAYDGVVVLGGFSFWMRSP